MSTSTTEEEWIKIDLHIHTLDDLKDAVDFSAHQLLERACSLGFRVLAITLHDAVFDRKEVFADAADMGILLISAAEVRLLGADVIVLNVTAEEVGQLRTFDDLRQLRARRGNSVFTIAPHPFYIFGGSIGSRLFAEIDCFDAHRLHAFGRHYTSMPIASALTVENVFAPLRSGPLRLTSPASTLTDFVSAIYFVFLAHPFRVRRKMSAPGAERTGTLRPHR